MRNIAIDEIDRLEYYNNDKRGITDIKNLRINLKGNFCDEIEKLFYDPKLNIITRPDSRELNLLKILNQKINKLNSLDW